MSFALPDWRLYSPQFLAFSSQTEYVVKVAAQKADTF